MKIKFTLILLVFSVLASAQDYPTKKIDGKEYYVYSVQVGEGLFSVSKKFGVLQSEIIAANPNIEKSGLKAGQTLYIPIKNAVQTSAQTAVKQQNNSQKVIEHVVQPKQTFFAICKMYGVPQEEILKINSEITDATKIKEGQIIKIPVVKTQQEPQNQNVKAAVVEKKEEKPQTAQKPAPKKRYISYEVKNKKESLYSISKEFGVSINELLEANPEAENGIKKGDILQIPAAESTDNQPKTEQKKNDELIHVVQPKETFFAICNKYNVSADDVLKINAEITEPTKIKVGQEIKIPQKAIAGQSKNDGNGKAVTEQARNDSGDKPIAAAEPTKKHLKIAFLLPFTSEGAQNVNTERFIEFYKGALLALEEAKKHGVSADVQTFDTGFGTGSFYRILSEKFFENVDLIVGPAYPEQAAQVAAFAKKNKIAQIVPFTSKIDKADKHEYLYQFNPATDEISRAVADEVKEKFPELKNCYSYSLFNEKNVSENYLESYEKWFGLRSCKGVPCYDLIGYDLLTYFCRADYNSFTKKFVGNNNVVFMQSNFNFLPQKNGKGYLNYGYFLNKNNCE